MADSIQIKEGKRAPDFVVTASNGNEVSLSNFLDAPLALFFYPKNTAQECVKALCDFRDHFAEFKNLGVRLVGASVETLDSHNKFISKYNIPFLLLCDKDMKISKLYGVFQPRKVAGSKVWAVVRTTFVIDEKGVIVKIYDNVRNPDHVEEVLTFLRERYLPV
ncbi:peroxiredoxin [Candidatus Sumerlaeota bacterium]|nr:peroxiredoxin [Candidatus Sumerlaeota bacterium]